MAVCNSSLESSEKGLEAYDLRDAEAFDSVEAMCKSDTVSLVVCAEAVFSHYDLIRSAIEAEKTSMLSSHFVDRLHRQKISRNWPRRKEFAQLSASRLAFPQLTLLWPLF
ncbi:hypothetical protein BFJ69_g8377 [Fusarium oxysporum]|uniref:Uncharacterized protein n=1 Tax=Fusarium oxysporum TaxID=5507 RepID=A0A420N303_FUSOX|nr:hypothetical protein BFJ69_g8377 [Fusarium oxysporum]